MRDAHVLVAWALIVLNAAAGAACLIVHWRSGRAHRLVWGLVVAAQASAWVQAVIGAVLARRGGRELGDMHALYGFTAVIAVMIMYGYRTSPFVRDKQLVLYGLGSLFIMGLGIRNLYL